VTKAVTEVIKKLKLANLFFFLSPLTKTIVTLSSRWCKRDSLVEDLREIDDRKAKREEYSLRVTMMNA
jgi:hypothetical protein